MARKTPSTDEASLEGAAALEADTPDAGAAAPPQAHRMEPVPGYPDAPPPCAGTWLRQADGALLPGDESTATAAGLAWPASAA